MAKQQFFKLDGVYYDLWVTELIRGFTVQDSSEAGRTISGNMVRDIIGTFYYYIMTLDATNCDPDDYAEFYNIISAPRDSHVVEFPFNGEVLKFRAYISLGEDSLKIRDGVNYWSELQVQFTAMEPYRR